MGESPDGGEISRKSSANVSRQTLTGDREVHQQLGGVDHSPCISAQSRAPRKVEWIPKLCLAHSEQLIPRGDSNCR